MSLSSFQDSSIFSVKVLMMPLGPSPCAHTEQQGWGDQHHQKPNPWLITTHPKRNRAQKRGVGLGLGEKSRGGRHSCGAAGLQGWGWYGADHSTAMP